MFFIRIIHPITQKWRDIMKLLIILALITFGLTITGCAVTAKKATVNYDRTNPVRIEKSIAGLPIVNFIGNNVDAYNDLIVLASMETFSSDDYYNWRLDSGTRYLIEDNILSSLKKGGYRIGERDPDVMWHLSRESKDKYNLYNFQFKGNEASKEEEAKAPEGAVINNYYYGEVDNSSNISKSDAKLSESETEETIFTDLTAADILLTYRVLECGVLYKEIEQEGLYSNTENINSINRLARTRLQCRLTNAKTGEILNSGIVENEEIDTISKEDMNNLKEMHYQFYEHTLPNIPEEAKEDQSVSAAAKAGGAILPSANPNQNAKWIFAIPLLLLIL